MSLPHSPSSDLIWLPDHVFFIVPCRPGQWDLGSASGTLSEPQSVLVRFSIWLILIITAIHHLIFDFQVYRLQIWDSKWMFLAWLKTHIPWSKKLRHVSLLLYVSTYNTKQLKIPKSWTILFSIWDPGSAHSNTMSCSWSRVSWIIHAWLYKWNSIITVSTHFLDVYANNLNCTCRFLLLKVWKLVWGFCFFNCLYLINRTEDHKSPDPVWEILWLSLLIIIGLWVIIYCSVDKYCMQKVYKCLKVSSKSAVLWKAIVPSTSGRAYGVVMVIIWWHIPHSDASEARKYGTFADCAMCLVSVCREWKEAFQMGIQRTMIVLKNMSLIQ